MIYFCCLELNQRCKDIFFYSVRPYQMCIKCTWEYAYHNASKSEANVRVLVVIRLRKSMHTGLRYPYVSTRSDALWHLRRGVEWWLIFQLFCFILWRFIFTEFMYIKNGMCRAGGGHSTFFFGGCVPHGFPKVGSRERIFLEKWGV